MQHRTNEVNNNLYESFKLNYLNFASNRGEIPSVDGFQFYINRLESKKGDGVLSESWDRISSHAKSDPDFTSVKTVDIQRNVKRLERTIKEELKRLR